MILHDFPRKYHELRQQLTSRYEQEEANSVAKLLLEHVTGTSWQSWQLQPDAPWQADWDAPLDSATQRLLAGEPIQHVTGLAHFFGREFQVNEHVLIPRQETEELVLWALQSIRPVDGIIRFLDIGTGSGCIAVSLASEWTTRGIPIQAAAMDVSEKALEVAASNAEEQKAVVDFHELDLFSTSSKTFSDLDLVISNPPYVTEGDKEEMTALVLDHDPHLALFAPQEDPLAFYRAIAERAQQWLRNGGWLMLEINASLGPETVQVIQQAGFQEVELRQDLNGRDRMVKGVK